MIWRRPGVQAGVIGAVAAILVALTIQSGGAATNDPDAAASVLFFRQITSGETLETFISTTPKPLLTVLYGAAWTISGDWRTLGWLTVVAYGIAVACGLALARRWAGPFGATFVVVALATSSNLVVEVSRANSVIWALAGWLAAGVALSRPSPRAWLAGVALLVAFLSRTETIVLVLPATAWLIVMWLRGDAARARSLSPILLAWLAPVIAGLHDLLLTGDPLSWVSVPAGYTALVAPDLRAIPPVVLLGEMVDRYAAMWVLVMLGVIGAVRLAARRRWAALVAIGALTAGISALLLVIAWRHVFVTTRYLEQVDVGVLAAAAIGAGWLGDVALRTIETRWSSRLRWPVVRRRLAPAAIGAIVVLLAAFGAGGPPAQLDGAVAAELARVRSASANAASVRASLATIVSASNDAAPEPIRGPAGLMIVDTRAAPLLVPRSLVSRLILDLDAPVTMIGDSWLAIRRDGARASLVAGQAIYHDRDADRRPALFSPLEIDRAVQVGTVVIEPVIVDPAAGIWILEAR